MMLCYRCYSGIKKETVRLAKLEKKGSNRGGPQKTSWCTCNYIKIAKCTSENREHNLETFNLALLQVRNPSWIKTKKVPLQLDYPK